MAEVDRRPRDRTARRKPFANLVKRLTNFKGNAENQNDKTGKRANGSGGALKPKKNNALSFSRNNPYPESGHLRVQQQASQPSFGAASRPQTDSLSYSSLPVSGSHDSEEPSNGNKSGAPTLATNPETINSEAGQSKAATTTTGGRALSSIDGAGANSTFSSPNHSVRSLATTLTTIQSQGNPMQAGNGASGNHHNHESQPNGTAYHHPFPTAASAIPRHLQGDVNQPNTYTSATANNLNTDNASILTLASSSKQRRRSMDTDASVRALAPSSVWGGSRESLPLSVLSGTVDAPGARPSMGGVPSASAERASIYSSSGLAGARESVGINSPALASERNSYYAKQAADAKSLRSITNLKDDARSINREHDVASIRSLAPSEARVGGHARNDSIPGSIGASPLSSPIFPRQASTAGNGPSLSRRSSDWRQLDADGETGSVDLEKKAE